MTPNTVAHRFRPKTPESASPPGEGEDPRRLRGRGGVLQGSPAEGEDRWPGRRVLDFGLAASPKQPPSPQPSPSRAREEERRRTRAFDPGPSRVVAGMVARKTPHRIRPKTADSASPLGEGEEQWPWRTVFDFGLAASPKQPPSPPDRGPGQALARGVRACSYRVIELVGCAEDPSPNLAEDGSPLSSERVKRGGPAGG